MGITARIFDAYIANHPTPVEELGAVILDIHLGLSRIAYGLPGPELIDLPRPAVPIEDSVTEDFIICLEDGCRLKSMKRHLRVQHGLTPNGYRARWGLPSNYPMEAAALGGKRTRKAKLQGLGRHARRPNMPDAARHDEEMSAE